MKKIIIKTLSVILVVSIILLITPAKVALYNVSGDNEPSTTPTNTSLDAYYAALDIANATAILNAVIAAEESLIANNITLSDTIVRYETIFILGEEFCVNMGGTFNINMNQIENIVSSIIYNPPSNRSSIWLDAPPPTTTSAPPETTATSSTISNNFSYTILFPHDENYIWGLSNYVTNYNEFMSKIFCENGQIQMYAQPNGLVGTGCTVSFLSETNKQFVTILYGDLDGDGFIDIPDLIKFKRYLLKIEVLTDAYLIAANCNRTINATPSISDLLKLKQHLLGLSTIDQN